MSREPAKSSRIILPGRVSLSFTIIPFLVQWGFGLGLGLWTASNVAVNANGELTGVRMFAACAQLAVFMLVGLGLGTLCRAILVDFMLESLTRRGEIGRALSAVARRFHKTSDNANGGLIIPRAARAARKAGLAEADSIVAALNAGKDAGPQLWWRTVLWCETFGDVMNHLLPYSGRVNSRPDHGWWADQILPGSHTGEAVLKARRSVIAAISHADPAEGHMLCAFLIEAQAFNRSELSVSERAEFTELARRAKSIADGIVENVKVLPVQGERGNLERIRRILAADSADTP